MDLVAIYKRDIDQYPSLGKEMELELALQARAGCLEAREALVKANLRWVVSIAARYADRAELLDLIQAGNMGLLRAVDRFDPTRGAKFSTYAFWPVHQAIRDELWREMYPLRLPRRSHYRLWHQARMRQRLTQTLGREPQVHELAATFNSSLSGLADRERQIIEMRYGWQDGVV